MTPVLRRLATLVLGLGLALLSGCSDDEDPSRTESPEGDPITVTLYDADFSVSVAGDLSVVETLTIDVPVDDRHGISRTFDGETEVDDFTATLDGEGTPVAVSSEDGASVFKIGDPDQTLSVGEHVVQLEYGVADVLTREGGARRFDWLLVSDDWELDIAATDLTVRLPSAASQAECTVGEEDPCDVSGVGTTTLLATTGALEEGTPVRLEALLPGG